MARRDETEHVGPAGRCNRMPLTLPHEGASSEPGDPIRATSSDCPTPNQDGQPTAQTKGELEIIPHCGFSPKHARKLLLSFLSCLQLDITSCRVLRSYGII